MKVTGKDRSKIMEHIRTMNKTAYPETRRDDVVDEYHGKKISDPYRWLENADSEETVRWVELQNSLTESFLSADSARDRIREDLTKLWNYPKYSVTRKEGDRYFFSKNDGLQNQPVLYMQRTLDSTPVKILDPNELSEDGTVAVDDEYYSDDGHLIAYKISSSGSDWHEIRIRDVDSLKDYDETIRWCKFGAVAWKHDNSGFFYSRYPEPGTVPEEDGSKYCRVYWHALGTSQEHDRMVFERPDIKELSFSPFTTEDGEYLMLNAFSMAGPKNRVYFRRMDSEGEFTRLIDDEDNSFYFIDKRGPLFYFKTDLDAPKGRIISIDINNPARESWKEIIPESDETLSMAISVNNTFVCVYLNHAHHTARLYSLTGEFIKSLPLQGIGTISFLSAQSRGTELFFTFTSFLCPSSTYRYDFVTGELKLFRKSELDFDPSGYETRQVFYKSKDGTTVPMFITHRKGMNLDGSNPAILYGYGGFSIDLTPFFSVANLLWIINGGIYAVANIRGGSEYGEDWHQAGMRDRKQNTFDDFIAAAEWLIDNRYTSPGRLAISGGSNGGLLVAACMCQRPELYGAVICEVPLTDMLRYHRFTVGYKWIGEYGNPERSADEFDTLIAYSPLHNVRSGVTYPALFVNTADHDDRVVASHAKKFVATIQHNNGTCHPILIRVQTKAGHGMGKPTTKVINDRSEVLAFLFKTFGIKYGN